MALAVLEAESVVGAAVQRLTSDTGPGGVSTLVGGRIYRDMIPQGAGYPAVVVAVQAATDDLTMGGDHVLQDVLVLVKVVDRGASYTTVQPIAKRIAERLEGYGRIVQDGVHIVKFRREAAPPQPAEVEQGVRYLHLNQLFRTEAYPA